MMINYSSQEYHKLPVVKEVYLLYKEEHSLHKSLM